MWIVRQKIKNYYLNKVFIRIGILCIGFLLTGGVFWIQLVNTLRMRQDNTKYISEVYSKKIEFMLEKFTAKTNILETAILSLGGTISEEDFNGTAQVLFDDPVIQGIQYLPDGVIKYCYPKEGNEALIGTNILENSDRREDALLAVQSRQNVVCGPYDLLQGKKGIVIWNPIFSKEGEEEFLGFSAVILDLEKLLNLCELNKLEKKGYGYILSYSDEGKEAVTISQSDENLSNDHSVSTKVHFANRTWDLHVIPSSNWSDWSESFIILISGIMITICLSELIVHIREKQTLLNQFELKEKILNLSLKYSDLSIFTYDFKTKQLVFETEGRIVQNLGKVIENVPEFLADTIIFPETKEDFLSMYEMMENGGKIATCVAKVKMKGNPYAWERITLIRIGSRGEGQDTVVGIIKDITKEKENEYRLEREKSYREAMILGAMFWAEAELKANLILYHASSEIEEEHNYDETLKTRIKGVIHPDDVELVLKTLDRERLYREYYEDGIRKQSIEFRFYKERNYIWAKMRLYLTQNEEDHDINLLLAIYNIDEKKKEELSLRYQAERDRLTNIYNRTAAEEKINHALIHCEEDMLSILFLIDLDNFKPINDKMGHNKGDQVLKDISVALRNYCGSDAIVGRLGGDEFLAFIQRKMSIEEIHQYADGMVKSLEYTYAEDNEAITVGASVGVVVVPKTSIDFNELYLQADKALYYVKYNNKNGYKIYGE